uniref:MFS domain-containing protein n=1 Tax=Rhabditophanes sp. KR3021 TaxID=114890 RepID=A0AC35TMZ7_9BILA
MIKSSDKTFDNAGSDWKSIYIISLFSLLDAIQYSFVTWSLYNFVQSLDSTISPQFIGVILGTSGVGEALSAIALGYWTNKIGRVNPPIIASILLSMAGNGLYIFLSKFPTFMMPIFLLLSRFLAGAGTGNRASYLAYTGSASTETDRTKAMALAGGSCLIGLTIGPSIQGLFTFIGKEGYDMGIFTVSMYTAPAFLGIIINALSIIYLHAFLDDRLDDDEVAHDTQSMLGSSGSESHIDEYDHHCDFEKPITKMSNESKMNVFAVVVCMLTRAVRMLVTANVESIGSPYSQIIISERMNCVIGLFGLLVFHLITMPWPFLTGSVDCSKFVDAQGVSKYEWCADLKPVNKWVYYSSYSFIFGIGLPLLNNSLQSLYSLVLGSGRQGTLQGINQAVGSMSRIFAPIVISTLFNKYGVKATWTLEITMLMLFLITWAIFYRKMCVVKESGNSYKIYSIESAQGSVKRKIEQIRYN